MILFLSDNFEILIKKAQQDSCLPWLATGVECVYTLEARDKLWLSVCETVPNDAQFVWVEEKGTLEMFEEDTSEDWPKTLRMTKEKS